MKHYEFTLSRRLVGEGLVYSAACARHVYDYVMQNCFNKDEMFKESAFLIFVDNQNRIIGHYLLAVGGSDSVILDKKIVCRALILSGATNCVIVHNHPGFDCLPSQFDIKQTEKIREALACIDSRLVDHIIVTENEFFSFTEEKKTSITTE